MQYPSPTHRAPVLFLTSFRLDLLGYWLWHLYYSPISKSPPPPYYQFITPLPSFREIIIYVCGFTLLFFFPTSFKFRLEEKIYFLFFLSKLFCSFVVCAFAVGLH